MKLRIITHHAVHNHGAVLQLYALQRILSRYDDSVCALDYKKNYDFLADYADSKYEISLKSIPFYLGYVARKGVKRTLFNVKKRRLLNRFKAQNKIVGEYYSRAQNVDAVFVGSDEVFSLEPGLNPFFWGMGVPARHMFAYAGCFGPTTLEFVREKFAQEYIEAGVRRFEEISVRDQNSQAIIEALSGTTPEQVCDPVILYGYAKEKASFKKPTNSKYLLVYAYDENMNDPNEWRAVREYARKRGLKVITAGFYHKWCDRCVNVDPIGLLEWVAGAECVVTDTFHGTVMSLVMNVPFATKIRGNRNKLGFLLSEYGLEKREIFDFAQLDAVLAQNLDYDAVNKTIESKQEQGLKFIERCVRRVGEK